MSCHDAVLDSCHSTCRRAQGSTNISHTHFICGKQLYTAKSYAKYFSETVQEFWAERDRKVTHQSGTFPEKYKQPYNCQRQKTLPASAYASMGLRHFAGSTYYPISKPQRMKRTIRKLAPYIQASGAKMVLYQTWAPGKWHNDYNRYDSVSNRSDYQSILNRTIAEIAEEHNALVAPVGTAFLLCSHSSYGIKLLMGDYSHPTVEGSYLAACVIYNTVFSRSSMGIPYTGTLDVMTAFKLQKLAETVCFAS